MPYVKSRQCFERSFKFICSEWVATSGSDVDLLVTLDGSTPVSTSELLETAGEAEELIGRPVDFVLRPSLEKSPNHFAREHILATAVCLYGNDQLGRLRDILEAGQLIGTYVKNTTETDFNVAP